MFTLISQLLGHSMGTPTQRPSFPVELKVLTIHQRQASPELSLSCLKGYGGCVVWHGGDNTCTESQARGETFLGWHLDFKADLLHPSLGAALENILERLERWLGA